MNVRLSVRRTLYSVTSVSARNASINYVQMLTRYALRYLAPASRIALVVYESCRLDARDVSANQK